MLMHYIISENVPSIEADTPPTRAIVIYVVVAAQAGVARVERLPQFLLDASLQESAHAQALRGAQDELFESGRN